MNTFTHQDISKCLELARAGYELDHRLIDAVLELQHMLHTYEMEVCTVLPGTATSHSLAYWRELYALNHRKMRPPARARIRYAKQTKVAFEPSAQVLTLKAKIK